MNMPSRFTLALALTFVAACQRSAPKPPRAGHYLYVMDYEQAEVTGYRLNEETGAVTQISDRPYLAGHGGLRFTAGPDGTFGFLGTTVETLPVTVGEDGGLTVGKGPALPDSVPIAAVHPSGRFLYLSGAAGLDLRSLAKDGAPGKEAIASYPVKPREMFIDAAGRQLLTFNEQDSLIHVFDIDAATGRLTEASHSPLQPEDTKTKAARLHPNGLLLFALAESRLGSRMHVFLRSTDGFTAVIGSPFPLRPDAQAFTFSPDGRYLFVVHTKTHLIAAYAIDDAGGIHPVVGSPFTSRPNPEVIEPDPGGRFLYVTYPAAGTVGLFSIAQDTGALTQVPGSTFRASGHPRVTTSVVPPVIVDVASLDSPESPGLQPVDTAVPGDQGAVAPPNPAASAAKTTPAR
jgi:6-phosphogluconolactonase (cycloisomerase 2 family)